VGGRIAGCLDPGDVVARLGGDEFAILLHDIPAPDRASVVAQRIIEALNAPIRLGVKEVFTSTSIGIALAAPRYAKSEELLRDADVAMYRAKAEGRHRYALFDERLHQEALRLLEIENDLRRAISRDELEPYFQPIVRLYDRSVVGYEALVRWRHPERGILLPGEFLPVAEENGSAEQIDWLMFDKVCAIAPALTAQGGFISINLSGRHFRSSELDRDIFAILDRHGVDPTCIRIEVTEGGLLENPAQVKQILVNLRRRGIGVALDDFGTGYSSLSYLHQYPLQVLKIDRSFVAELHPHDDGSSSAVVRAIQALASSLGMQVIAEGIESEEQHAALDAIGCEFGQGFLFATPQPAAHWLT
jgi:predicted signal transduction protein with EAL and GGDEF domain